jgi:bacillithiol biosynthesis deacetylase BshB1
MKLDILVLAVHPDDAELGCGGTILKHAAMGKKVGIVDLTRGELGTRGTAETRDAEGREAGRILGLTVRDNIAIRDGFFRNDEEHQLKVIRQIRKYQPEIVITNAYTDRHPDHGRASDLVSDAAFLSGLKKVVTTGDDGASQEAWRPNILLHFIQDMYIEADIVVDVTEHWDKKIESVLAYKTQFYNPESTEGDATYISSPAFLKIVEGRAREFGKSIGAEYGEGFTCKRILGVSNLFELR